ncbi:MULTISPECIES: tetratricopeptide repeat protein [unclassified Microcoleus]|uniref:tetratricopeptide repeat protein n=1 Tax=unclassified Microcoleus TaxID=2642155 RepID=UPI004040C188
MGWGKKFTTPARITIGDIEAAIESYEKATKIQPYSGEIWYAKGLAFLDLNRYGAAIISFRRATQ